MEGPPSTLRRPSETWCMSSSYSGWALRLFDTENRSSKVFLVLRSLICLWSFWSFLIFGFLFIKLCRHMNILTWCLLILQYNANVKVVDHEGRNALWYARSSGSNECVELLMNNGCPEHPTLPRRRGSSAQAGKNDVFEKLPASVIWALPWWLCAWR